MQSNTVCNTCADAIYSLKLFLLTTVAIWISMTRLVTNSKSGLSEHHVSARKMVDKPALNSETRMLLPSPGMQQLRRQIPCCKRSSLYSSQVTRCFIELLSVYRLLCLETVNLTATFATKTSSNKFINFSKQNTRQKTYSIAKVNFLVYIKSFSVLFFVFILFWFVFNSFF